MITALVLTYNEENRIGFVLDCLSKFTDIIIMDKSSTDRTREIVVERGAKVIQFPYFRDTPPEEVMRELREYLLNNAKSEWILSLTSSDIVHHGLYECLCRSIHKYGKKYSVLNVPIFRYSMGICGKDTLFGEISYQAILFRRDMYPEKPAPVHENVFRDCIKRNIDCPDPRIGIYHLTHPTLEHVMDRHIRYAAQYVEDQEKINGKSREQIMKYAWHEMVRVVGRYFKRGVFKKKETGLAQCMTLLMYNAMIYLNAYFSKEQEAKIERKYQKIRDMCKGS